jgi:hypothetical protein
MNLWIVHQSGPKAAYFAARGFDPFAAPAAGVYLVAEATDEPVIELMARLQQAEPAIGPASEEDSRGGRTPDRKTG